MVGRKCNIIALAVLAAIIANVFPFVLRIERLEIVQTEARRVDHAEADDFGAGKTDGSFAVVFGERSVLLTLGSPGRGAFFSPPIDLRMSASSATLHWVETFGRSGRVELALSTSVDGTIWSDWQRVVPEGESVTAGRRKVFGALVAGGGSRYARYRVTMHGWGATLPEVHSVTLFGLDSATAPTRSEWRITSVPRNKAHATIKPQDIVSRQMWGADESLRFETPFDAPPEPLWPEEIARIERIIVHQTAGPNVCSSHELYCQHRSVIAINDIYYQHAVLNGWGDIGYNSLIGYDGRIYEGRAGPTPHGGDPLVYPVIAGHAFGHNARTHGVALMGEFSSEPVPDLQYEALADLVGWIVTSNLAESGRIDPLGFAEYQRGDGKLTLPLPSIIGHRDVNPTECPGDHLYERLIHLRHLAERLAEWPPVHVWLRARPQGDVIAYHISVENYEPELVSNLTIKGAVPWNADFVDSWAGSPYRNRGVFDGSVVTWHDPKARLDPGRDRREYVMIVRPRPGVSRAEIQAVAWVEFIDPIRGVAVSEKVSADVPIEIVVDPVVSGNTTAVGDWPLSRSVPGYFGDAYSFHYPGDGSATYTWEAELVEDGRYEVFAWWTAAFDRATNAPYIIEAVDGHWTTRVDQQGGGARWVSLGVYSFEAGPARVSLSNDADGVVIADAVRLRRTR